MMSYGRRASGGPVPNGLGFLTAFPNANVGEVMTLMMSSVPARALKINDFLSADQRG